MRAILWLVAVGLAACSSTPAPRCLAGRDLPTSTCDPTGEGPAFTDGAGNVWVQACPGDTQPYCLAGGEVALPPQASQPTCSAGAVRCANGAAPTCVIGGRLNANGSVTCTISVSTADGGT